MNGPNIPDAYVVGITATFNRPVELYRLIASLPAAGRAMRALVVVDNANSEEVRRLTDSITAIPIIYYAPGSNLGCGGGLEAGERLVLERFGEEVTHFWILDDDAVVCSGALEILLEAMSEQGADVAHPLSIDCHGFLGWFPGLLEQRKFHAIKAHQTPDRFIAQCGPEPIAFSWAQGIALLVSRGAIDKLGFHRTDYWVRGEDLEFSLRLTSHFRGVYVPKAHVRHLPPSSPGVSDNSEYSKHRAMLQNIAYTSLRLPHGRRLAATLPGNCLRFIRTWWSVRLGVFADLARALWRGAVLGLPAGYSNSRRHS